MLDRKYGIYIIYVWSLFSSRTVYAYHDNDCSITCLIIDYIVSIFVYILILVFAKFQAPPPPPY